MRQKQVRYGVTFQDWDNTLNARSKAAALALPAWSTQDLGVFRKYLAHFQAYGTHMVMTTEYGRRYALTINADNSSQSQKTIFSVNVSAEYLGNSVNMSVTSGTDYKTYANSKNVQIDASGGDPALGALVQNDPENRDKRDAWLATWGTAPNEGLISCTVTEIGPLYTSTDVVDLQNAGHNLAAAFVYLHTAPRRTRCHISCQTTEARFQLMDNNSFGARIEDLKGVQLPEIVLSSNKVPPDDSLDFYIVNDGSTIQFTMAAAWQNNDPWFPETSWVRVEFSGEGLSEQRELFVRFAGDPRIVAYKVDPITSNPDFVAS